MEKLQGSVTIVWRTLNILIKQFQNAECLSALKKILFTDWINTERSNSLKSKENLDKVLHNFLFITKEKDLNKCDEINFEKSRVGNAKAKTVVKVGKSIKCKLREWSNYPFKSSAIWSTSSIACVHYSRIDQRARKTLLTTDMNEHLIN